MAEKIVKFGDEAVEEIAGLKRIQQTLFPNGIEFSPNEFVEYIQTKSPDELTVKDAVLSKLYASGMKVVPDMGVMRDPSTKEFAKQFSDVFSKKRIGTAQQIIGFDKDLTKLLENVNLDDRIDDVKSKIPKYSPLETAIKKIQSGKLPKGIQGTKLLNATVLRDRGNDIVQALAQGLADMPNGVTKDAILVGMMGSRFVDIQRFRQTAEQAKEASQERPYFDYETGTQVNLDREGRKQLGPSKKLPSVTAQILKNRYDNAGETGELFKGVTRSSINKDLKKYVFSQIPEDINLGRDIEDLTYTDLRRIVANFVANSLGNPKAADEIISHEGNLDTLDTKISSVFEKYYAKIENPNSELARTKGLLLYEKELAKGLGATDPMDFANKLGLGPDLKTGVRYLPKFTAPEYPEVDVKIDETGNVQKTKEIVLTPEQEQARAFEDTETRFLKGEQARSRRIDIQEENLERLSRMSEKKIVEGAEKEALLEQTKTDTKTKLRQEQRTKTQKANQKLAVDEAKKGLDEAGKHFNNIFGGPRTLKSIAGLVGVGTATKLTAGVLSGGTAVLPLAAEAAAEVALSSTPTGEKAIDPKTGLEYMQPERPPSDFMSKEDIKKTSIMAKGQFKPNIFQRSFLDREVQRNKIESLKGQSFLTGSGIN